MIPFSLLHCISAAIKVIFGDKTTNMCILASLIDMHGNSYMYEPAKQLIVKHNI